MKYLIWAAIIYLAWRWYSVAKQSSPGSAPSTESSSPASNSGANDVAEAMVKCAHCGVHLPHSEAVHAAGAITYCSQEHQRLHGEA